MVSNSKIAIKIGDKIIERKIGEIFKCHNTFLQVWEAKESDGCNGCFFEEYRPLCLPYKCTAQEREDGKNVQFKEISKTMITRENAKELLPILQAFAEGKQIQDKIEGVTDWVDTDEINFEYEGQKIKHRIKPEPKYRPFKSQEECWNEMLKHQPFGWVKDEYKYVNIVGVHKTGIEFSPDIDNDGTLFTSIMDFTSMCEQGGYTFADGEPFGIKEE